MPERRGRAIQKAVESPLVPDGLASNVAALLREFRSGTKRRGAVSARKSLVEQGALRASVLLTLRPGDWICDLSRVELGRASSAGRLLFWLELPAGAGPRNGWVLLGAALALRAATGSAVGLLLVSAATLKRREWRSVLRLAVEHALPLVLVVLPERDGEPLRLPGIPGLPVIPVDAADALALCRVLGESCLRARNGDGPALVHAVHWRL